MKVIKKITAIMLSIMMVLGMCSVVGAVDAGTGETGSITIKNAIVGQDYKIYKILTLESYEPNEKLYSYKPAQGWEAFFGESGKGSEYVNINENGYVTWKPEVNEAKAADLAQAALEYATTNVGKGVFDENNDIHEAHATSTGTEKTVSLTVNKLPFGYYLVDSSAGALCSLNTTNPEAEIQEKNEVPSVEKKIIDNEKGEVDFNSANIGDPVTYKITINVKPGAENYILHDQMDSHLKFDKIVQIYDDDTTPNNSMTINDYKYVANPGDDCTFHIELTKDYLTRKADLINKKVVTTITFIYSATVADSAIVNQAMLNTAWLTYGDNKESNKPETKTYTFGIPVFKHTGTGNDKQALAGAEFELYTDAECTEANALKFTKNNADKYRYDAKNGIVTLTSLADGTINIEGIKEGKYYLKETKAPKGYNLLKDVKMIVIDADGKIKIDGTDATRVDVQNVSGSLLPSTGGMGTTVFYIAGALLVLISGVVLIAKKRTDSK